MNTDLQSLLLLGAGSAFFLYIVGKLIAGRMLRDPRAQAAHAKLREAKRRAADRSSSASERAAALREASAVALQELRQPGLAASYALRAERMHPADADGVGLLAAALRKSTKYRALERILWRQLALQARGSAGYERAFQELVGLYDGPLSKPEAAQVLRALKSAATG